MRYSKQLLTLILLMVFTLPALAHQRYDSNYNRGLSINLGYASDGLRLGYSNSHPPRKYFSTHQDYNSYSKSKKQNKAYPYLGYQKRHYLPARPYGNRYDRFDHHGQKHSAYKSHYNYKDRKHNKYSNYQLKPCHPVTKLITDVYGYYHSVQSTMCYNQYGQGYIVYRH